MKRYCAFLLCTVLISTIALSAFAAEGSVGSVRIALNSVKIRSADGKARAPKIGSPVFVGDTIITGPSGKIKILFDNDNILVLGSNSNVKVDELVYDTKTNESRSIFTLIQGKLRAMVKKLFTPSSHFKIKTANSDIGVLGTDFMVFYEPKTDTLEAYVESGKIYIESPKKRFERLLLLENYSTTLKKGMKPPAPKPADKQYFSPLKEELTVYENIEIKPSEEYREEIKGEKAPESEPESLETAPVEAPEVPVVPPIDQQPQTGEVKVKVITEFP